MVDPILTSHKFIKLRATTDHIDFFYMRAADIQTINEFAGKTFVTLRGMPTHEDDEPYYSVKEKPQEIVDLISESEAN